MRPVTVTIEGLRSFRRPVTIDFADRQLIAVIGDTGAGKSSILEALTWALYGNATWVKQAAALVGDGAPLMRVRLVFTADAHTWQVTRAVRRRQDGTPGAASAELVCLDGDRPAADGVRQVDAAVERILGLDWEAFTRTVVLPQGQFARLLTEGGVDRMRILSQIWRTDDLVAARTQADDALRELSAHLERLRGRREAYPDDVAAELAAARTAADQAETAAAAVADAVAEVGRCQAAVEQAQRRADAVGDAAERLRAAALPDPAAEAHAIAARAGDLDERLRTLDTRIAAGERAVAALADGRDDPGPDRAATRQAVATLDNLADSLPDLAEHLRRVGELRATAGEQRSAAAALGTAAAEADDAARTADADVARWQRVHAAATAAHGLHAGADCPVCRRALPGAWSPPDAAGLTQATAQQERARDEARAARDRSREAATQARETARQGEEEARRLAGRLERVAAAVADLPEPLRPTLPHPFTVAALHPAQLDAGLLAAARAAAHARQERVDARDAELRSARETLQGLREERTDLRERRHSAVVEPASALRLRLERICERLQGCAQVGVTLPRAVPALGEALDGLADDAQAVAALADSALEAAGQAARHSQAQAAEHRRRVDAVLATSDVGSVEALADRHGYLRGQAGQARHRVEELHRIAPVVAALDSHLEQAATAAGGLADLKVLLQDGRFVRWLTLRRSRALLAVASTLLDEMTGGRYAFADITDEHAEWRVFDTETGYARSPRTLSGGESFVASLALALGMVEMVARSGGRLDALFLDEGFGALDRGNLDAAIDALESTATRGRMVAVISHVQAVAERLTDVLAVDRAPSGSQARWLTAGERDGAAAADAAASTLLA